MRIRSTPPQAQFYLLSEFADSAAAAVLLSEFAQRTANRPAPFAVALQSSKSSVIQVTSFRLSPVTGARPVGFPTQPQVIPISFGRGARINSLTIDRQ